MLAFELLQFAEQPIVLGVARHRRVEYIVLVVVIDVQREARKIVFEDEEAKEFRIAQLNGDIPGQHDGEVDGDAGDPEGARDGTPVTLYGDEEKDDDRGQSGRDRAFGQSSERQSNVEGGEINV